VSTIEIVNEVFVSLPTYSVRGLPVGSTVTDTTGTPWVLTPSTAAVNHTTVESVAGDTSLRWLQLNVGSYGSDVIIQLANAASALVNAREDITSLSVTTAGAEFAQLIFKLICNGSLADIAAFTYDGNTVTPRMYLGDPATKIGLVRVSNTNLQLWLNGGAPLDLAFNGAAWSTRVNEAMANATVATNTLTMTNTGNLFVVPGTPTINGITIGSNSQGFSCRLKVASGTTIVHNSGAPGAGAAAILTPTAANIVTSSTRVLPISYDGTNFFVDG
jgi:hypothetical protein